MKGFEEIFAQNSSVPKESLDISYNNLNLGNLIYRKKLRQISEIISRILYEVNALRAKSSTLGLCLMRMRICKFIARAYTTTLSTKRTLLLLGIIGNYRSYSDRVRVRIAPIDGIFSAKSVIINVSNSHPMKTYNKLQKDMWRFYSKD